ncbi:glycosyltransferase family 25 protein [Rhizobium sp. FY34]|uniref:glycosyltransferase family 25 protein n=1 Tax=Rhizobium sp. FY34 TaxID=2562309 RepID=UPI001FEF3364|nr:glycosyltransferase family 25 protein [Rhizobium sp. FY34]
MRERQPPPEPKTRTETAKQHGLTACKAGVFNDTRISAIQSRHSAQVDSTLLMKISVYAINLDRSADRWSELHQQAETLDLQLIRVPAIDGAKLSPHDWHDCDDREFQRRNGRLVLPGEYGCYKSHLKALAAFIASGDPAAVIVEDDVRLTTDLAERIQALMTARPEAELIKLYNHRIVWFRHFATSSHGDEIGRAAHGPQGSAACYLVTRSGALKLLKSLKVMHYPWDVALERAWVTGARTYATREPVVQSTHARTTIATGSAYRASKFRWWKRMSTYAMRTIESARRIFYALIG